MDILQAITQELGVQKWQVEAAVKLIDEGNTIPFISRYRKEATGTLNDEQLRNLNERLTYLRNLEDKKNQVLSSIEDQGKLTEELKAQILAAQTLVVVEDLYRPYRPKRRTRATIAKEKGLEPLANIIMLQMTNKSIEEEAEAFVSEEKEVASVADAIAGAKDIIAEHISDEADYRIHIRDLTAKKGTISSVAKDPETQSVYEMYYEFEEPVKKLAGHRVLALNRGEKEKFLTIKIAMRTSSNTCSESKKRIIHIQPMILILGGTTEGRTAVKVADEAGKPYFYSTKGEWQEIQCKHGIRITGGMNTEKMESFCRQNDIRLLVDAAHPFASQLHRTVDETSRTLHLPVIRFERKYPPRTENIIWCEDYTDAIYQLEKAGTDHLLALTGVQTIGKLRPYWEKHTCWFRVLERETSITLAQEQGFPKENLVFYHAGEAFLSKSAFQRGACRIFGREETRICRTSVIS